MLNLWRLLRQGISVAVAFAVLQSVTVAQQGLLLAQIPRSQGPIQKPNTAVPAVPATQTGIELYKALFFATGPIGQMIPTMQKLAPYFPPEYKQLENPMVTYIQRTNPAFFAGFATQIQSGNHVDVANALRQASSIHKDALFEVAKVNQPEFAKRLQAAMPEAMNARGTNQYKQVSHVGLERNPEVDVTLALELALALLVVLVLVIFAITSPPPNLQGITFDRFVDEVVQKVPRRP